MFGSQLMVCPIYSYKARTRSVYFPENTGWYSLYDGSFLKGGKRLSVEAPFDRMPVYVPAGSILTTGARIENTTQPQNDLTLYVYAGRDGAFSLYEDENLNYNYEKGACSTIGFNWNDASKTLTISDRKGSFKGMVAERDLQIILVTPDKPAGLDVPVNGTTIHYTGKQLFVILK